MNGFSIGYQAEVLLGNIHYICYLLRGWLLCFSDAMSTRVPKN